MVRPSNRLITSRNRARWSAGQLILSVACLGGLMALAPDSGTGASSQPAGTDEVKVSNPLPVMSSEKVPWVAPPKTDAPADITVPQNTHPAPAVKLNDPLPAALEGKLSPIDRNKVYFDEPGDGNLWARGKTYKMSFGPGGAMYVPFMGSDAPRSWPVTFQLQAVTVGPGAIEFAASVSATRADHTISLDHGAVIEQYQLAPESVEQTFVFNQLPAGGDLQVSIGVQTDMAKDVTDAALRFSNERGSVSYSKAVVLDSAGHRMDAATAFTTDGIQITVPASFLKEAAFPITIDPVVSTFLVHDAFPDPDDARTPDVAFDVSTGRYLICYEDFFAVGDSDVFAELRSAGGLLIAASGEFIDFTTDNWRNPRCANNGIDDQFLVVAEEGAAPTRVISGRTREATSPVAMGVQFLISVADQTGDKLNPDVGGDAVTTPPTQYCVVWERVFTATDRDVHARMVNANSTLDGPGTILVDNSASTVDRFPSVSKSDGIAPFATQRYNVVWQRTFSATDEDIRGAQILWDGSIVTPSFSLDFSGANDQFPQASSILDGAVGTRRWLAVYQRGPAGATTIIGRVMDEAVSVTSADLTALGAFTPGQDQVLPAADSDGTRFVVAGSERFSLSLSDLDVYISTLCLTGTTLTVADSFRNLAFSSSTESQVQLTSIHSGGGGATRFAAVWRDAGSTSSTALGTIEAGLYDAGPPNNDDCVDASQVGAPSVTNGSVFCATNDGTASCGSSATNRDVWYRFTAPSHGQLRVNTCGTHDAPGLNLGMDTVLSLRANNCAGAELTCNDDWPFSALPTVCSATDTGILRDSYVQTDMLAGHSVLIRVSHFSGTIANGSFILRVSYIADPCAADLNNDGHVNGLDIGILLAAWSIPAAAPGCGGAFNCLPDLNGDGLVNGLDIGIMLAAWSIPPTDFCF